MHFVSSSMLKEAEHQLLQAQVWRSLKFAFGPLLLQWCRAGEARPAVAAVAGACAAYTAGGGSG